MVAIYSKMELYKRLDEGSGSWSSTAIDITEFFGKDIKKAMGTKKDTFKFNILNSNNKYFVLGAIIEKGDRIKIYQKNNSNIFTDNDILIDAVVTSIMSQNDTTKMLTISGASRTEQFLEGLTFVASRNLMTPPEILEAALSFHNNNNKNFIVEWDTNNPTTKSDGSPFPSYYPEDFYKPMNLLFERYSSNEYTKDGTYYYYIDDNNKVRWGKKELVSSGTIEETTAESVKINDNNDLIINSVVINCGRSPNNKTIRTYYFDYASRAKDGAKWKYMSSTNTISEDALLTERNENPSSFTSTSGRFPSTYPYTTTFGETCANDGEFEEVMVEHIKNTGLTRAKAYVQGINQSRINVTIQYPFTKDYQIAESYVCNLPSYGVEGQLLRCIDIQYTDYNTILTLLQDEEV